MQSLARAGGFQQWAKRDRIKLIRQQGDKSFTLIFDYDAVLSGTSLQAHAQLMAGDTIVVE